MHREKAYLIIILSAFSCLWLIPRAYAISTVMQAYNGSDGPFNVTTVNGYTVNQAASTGPGTWASFQYYHRPSGINFATGITLYVEVDYVDTGGSGKIGMQYDAVGNAFQNVGFALNNGVEGGGSLKTAVYELPNADFQLAENGGNDLRLTQGGGLQMNIAQVRVSDQPTPLYLQLTAFLGPYAGPVYTSGPQVDSTSLAGKMVCGYQGWFRTPNDDDDTNWQHWTKQWGTLNPSLISEDYWPDMTEFTSAEQFAALGFTNSDGSQAMLFSSDRFRTVLRHFQWMQAWGIDGVAVQRFVNGLNPPGIDGLRVLTDVRQAANETGRVYYVEYDMTGVAENQLVSTISNDWHYLIDTLKITSDSRYLHQGGLPVAGVYGFFADRFSTGTANAILDIFQTPGPYQAFVAGAGEWYHATDANWTPAWDSVLYRMGSWQPWNAGNTTGGSPAYATTNYWSADMTNLASHGVMYQAEIYPGASSNNRDSKPMGTETIPRLGGNFLWQQFVTATNLNIPALFLGMFDELDEGTQIVKAANTPPSQASFINYEGQPSDCYLCYASQGEKMWKGQMALSNSPPNCPGLTRLSIPDTVSPTLNATAAGPSISFNWSQVFPASAASSGLNYFQITVDGQSYTTSAQSLLLNLSPGSHSWQVQAVNSLGNASGWSLPTAFTVNGPTFSPTLSFSPSFTRTPSCSSTSTPSVSLTDTPISSPSFTVTPTSSRSTSPSASPSSIPSPTFSFSASPSQTALLPTPSLTRTLVPSSTPSSSPSLTPTQVPTYASPSATASTSPSALSATKTLTPSPSTSPSCTLTLSPSFSPTPSTTLSYMPTFTFSSSATFRPSATPSHSASSTASLSPSPSLTPSGSPTILTTATSTPLPSSSPSYTPSLNPSPSSSPIVMASLTATITAVPSISSSPGPGQVERVLAWPNPQSGPNYLFRFKLNAPANSIYASLYTKSMVLIARIQLEQAWLDGWNTLYWTLPDLSSGIYYLRLSTIPQGPAQIGSLAVLR